jgi:uncharacterized membrane protein
MVILIPIIAEFGTFLLAGIVIYAAVKRYGRNTGFAIIICSILWTTPIETLGVASRDYTYLAYSGVLAPNYPGYLLWLGIVPLWVSLGWFIISLSSFMIFHDIISGQRRAIVPAVLAGLLAVNIDLMVDPVSSSNKLWVWIVPGLDLFGVPLYNFVGWFLMILFFDLIIWHTITGVHPIKPLSFIENKLFAFKDRMVNTISFGQRLKLFGVRMILFELIVIFSLKALADVVVKLSF